MENEERIAILCWKWATATERGDFFCVSETITFIFPSNEISPEWERRRTAQVVEEGGKHFVRRHVRGGSRSVGGGELERTDPERHHAHVRRARIDSFHLRVWSSSSSSEPRGEREEGRRAVFLGADMHIMRAAHLNIGADDDDQGIHQNGLARRRFAVVSSSSFVD